MVRGQTKRNTSAGWSDELGRLLLAPLSDETLARHWDAPASEVATASSADGSQDVAKNLRRELLDWARHDEDVRRWLMQAWREVNQEIVDALEFVAMDQLANERESIIETFDLEDIALSLITDDYDDGWDLAESFAGRLADSPRRSFERILRRLSGEAAPPERVAKFVVLGGHPRDESRLADRFADAGPFEIRWKTFERKNSGSVGARAVAAALRDADAAIIVLGMASHALAHMVKAYAQQNRIPCRCVDKVTERQLSEAIEFLLGLIGHPSKPNSQ